jgi:SNF2 family DNA or RNA helicase
MTDETFPFVYKPYKHQLKIWKESRDTLHYALFCEMGVGKSKIIIDTMAWLWFQDKIDIVLILAKKGEYSNWRDVELPEHMPLQVKYECHNYRSGMRLAEREALRKLMVPDKDKLRILAVNVEALNEKSEGHTVARFFAKTRRKGMMIVVDESTCVKSPKAIRSKITYQLAEFAKYRRILTGTPITRSPMDLWGQCLVLGRGILGHKSFYAFKGTYAIEEVQFYGQRHFKAIKGYKNLDMLQNKLKTFATVMTRAECLDLPDKIYKKVSVPLTDEQYKCYEQMRREALVELGDGEIIEATNILGVITRLDQIACGQLRMPDGRFEILDSNRPDALVTQLEESVGKGIIWCNYRGLCEFLYDFLCKQYGTKFVGRFYGGVSDEERAETIANFQNAKHPLYWIVANQQSLGYGRTLTTGKNNFYFSNGYNLEHRLQSEDRTMRIGQDSQVVYTDFFSKDTINERVLYLLRQKKTLAHAVLGTKITDWI